MSWLVYGFMLLMIVRLQMTIRFLRKELDRLRDDAEADTKAGEQ